MTSIAPGADEHLGDLERLLAVVGLGDEQVVGVDAELLRVLGVERVLGVDEGREAPGLLGLGDDLERERRLARGLGPEDLDDAAARDAADAERGVHGERAGRDHRDRHVGLVSQPHDRALAELPLDLRQRRFDGAPLLVGFHAGHVLTFLAGACAAGEFRAMRRDYSLRRCRRQDAMRTDGSSLRARSACQCRTSAARSDEARRGVPRDRLRLRSLAGRARAPPARPSASLLAAAIAVMLASSHGPSLGRAVGLLMSGLAVAADRRRRLGPGLPGARREGPGLHRDRRGGGAAARLAPGAALPVSVPRGRRRRLARSPSSLFRVFDIVKPGPIRRLQDLPEGLGRRRGRRPGGPARGGRDRGGGVAPLGRAALDLDLAAAEGEVLRDEPLSATRPGGSAARRGCSAASGPRPGSRGCSPRPTARGCRSRSSEWARTCSSRTRDSRASCCASRASSWRSRSRASALVAGGGAALGGVCARPRRARASRASRRSRGFRPRSAARSASTPAPTAARSSTCSRACGSCPARGERREAERLGDLRTAIAGPRSASRGRSWRGRRCALTRAPREQIEAKHAEVADKRRGALPSEPNAGSVFKNPPGDYAGRLIEACGLKGERRGGAAISDAPRQRDRQHAAARAPPTSWP